jgi:hypothetical protein
VSSRLRIQVTITNLKKETVITQTLFVALTGNQEPGNRNQESGNRNQEPGTKVKKLTEIGARW